MQEMNVTGREIVVFGLVVLAVLLGGLLLLSLFWGLGGMGFGMMRPGMMGPGMMGGFGIFWGLLACLMPLGLIALLVLGAIWLLVLGSLGLRQMAGPMWGPFGLFSGGFRSNGERIYFTATSNSGQSISAEMAGMQMMHPGMMTCATCHGPDGRGGRGWGGGGTFETPDIRYSTLTEGEHDDAHAEHPPYTDETIKRAITQGIDPAGEPLNWPMPRWRMSERDLDDLLDYLKTLE
jgi:mono/diheme cytochrome c family protein